METARHRQSAMSTAMSLASKKLQQILDSRDNPDRTILKEIWSLLVDVDSEKNKSVDSEPSKFSCNVHITGIYMYNH